MRARAFWMPLSDMVVDDPEASTGGAREPIKDVARGRIGGIALSISTKVGCIVVQ
jgi:hypothetical protein